MVQSGVVSPMKFKILYIILISTGFFANAQDCSFKQDYSIKYDYRTEITKENQFNLCMYAYCLFYSENTDSLYRAERLFERLIEFDSSTYPLETFTPIIESIIRKSVSLLYSQRSILDTNIVQLKVACEPKIIRDRKDVNFILEIINKSSKEITIPKNYEFTREEDGISNMVFDIKLCSADTGNYCRIGLASDCIFTDLNQFVVLEPHDSYFFRTSINPGYFPIKGLYKVRFFSQESTEMNYIPHLSTDWIDVSVEVDFSIY